MAYKRLPPQLRGIKKMNGREYIWLLDHEGVPHRHFLDQYRKTKRPEKKDGKK